MRTRHLAYVFLAIVLQLVAVGPADAGEWVYLGSYKDTYFADQPVVRQVEIRIKGNPGDKTYLAQVFITGLPDSEGSYYPSTRRFRTKLYDGTWDKDRKAFSLKREDKVVCYCGPTNTSRSDPAPSSGEALPEAIAGAWDVQDVHTDGCGKTYNYTVTFSGTPSSVKAEFDCYGLHTFQGTLAGDVCSMTFSWPGGSGEGTVKFSGSTLTGTFSDSLSHTCTWTGKRIARQTLGDGRAD